MEPLVLPAARLRAWTERVWALGGLLTAAPAMVRRVNGLSWDSADAGAQPSARRSPRCRPVSGCLWQVQLPALMLRQAKNPVVLFPGKLFQVCAPPSRCYALQRARLPRSRPCALCASPTRLPRAARCQAWTSATPRMSTNAPATGRCTAGERKHPGEQRGRHRSHFGAGSCRADFSRITISDLPRLSPVSGTQIHRLAETSHQQEPEGRCQQH